MTCPWFLATVCCCLWWTPTLCPHQKAEVFHEQIFNIEHSLDHVIIISTNEDEHILYEDDKLLTIHKTPILLKEFHESESGFSAINHIPTGSRNRISQHWRACCKRGVTHYTWPIHRKADKQVCHISKLFSVWQVDVYFCLGWWHISLWDLLLNIK